MKKYISFIDELTETVQRSHIDGFISSINESIPAESRNVYIDASSKTVFNVLPDAVIEAFVSTFNENTKSKCDAKLKLLKLHLKLIASPKLFGLKK